VRAGYECLAGLDDVLHRVQDLSARTIIFDVEPLVAYWDTGQEALDRGVALVVSRAGAVPGVQVLCFATNSARHPSVIPGSQGVRVIYLASAGKPLRIARYRELPAPGVVVGDQLATDGVLARRLRYAFVQYCPQLPGIPAGPRLMGGLGSLMRPLLFTPPS
jgi:predicted HAD superfamily phosphohydrolase YqeG